jgi:serine protease inhibitor
MKTLKLIFAILVVLITSCNKDDNDDSNNTIEISEKQKEVIASSNSFGFEIFKELNEKDNNENNLFISPLSMSMALGMTLNGAEGDTKEDMQNTLGFENIDIESMNDAYLNLSTSLLEADPKVEFSLANSIWYRLGFNVLQPFIDINQEHFDAEVNELDFNRSDAVDIINGWIAEKTNDKIKDVIKEISPQTVMFLINAIYFKGSWKYEFDETETEDKGFLTADNQNLQVPTMQQQALHSYYENDLFRSVELPYGDEKFNMLLFLPNEGKTTNDVISEFNDDNWASWTGSLEKSDTVILELPKFKIEYFKKLKENLTNLGMGVAFSSMADFSNITPIDVLISDVIHKSFIEINEEGTEAAAVTVVIIDYTSEHGGNSKIELHFDKPFVFAIYEKNTNAILFLGEVLNPITE